MKTLITLFLGLSVAGTAFAQVDTVSYPEERRVIRQLMHQRTQPIDCSDFIAVGPKGDISFSHQQWQQVQRKEQLVFKSVEVVPGTEFIRIYDGTSAVVNFLAAVQLVVAGQDISIKVRRIEVYHKNNGNWCRVAGQGTEVDEQLFPTPASAAKPRSTEEEIRDLDQQEAKATISGDTLALKRLWSPGYIVNNPANTVVDVTQIRALIKEGKIDYSNFSRVTERVSITGNVAVTMGYEVVQPQKNTDNAGTTVTRRYTDVWQKGASGWQIIARQATIINIQ
ncbi:MAG: nuclear transport factor 2 family protein [Niabella sp.]